MQTINHIINGEIVPSRSGKTFLSENPGTEEMISIAWKHPNVFIGTGRCLEELTARSSEQPGF